MKKDFESGVNDLVHAIGLTIRRLRAAAPAHGLSLTEASVLSRLSKEGPATTADLARAERVKPQSMGATVTALEEEGLVDRRAHPTDGRQMLIRLTAKGEALRNSTKAAKIDWLAHAVAELDREEQLTLWKAAEIIRRVAEE